MQFLGIFENETSFDAAKVVVLPVPYEATTSYGKGTKNGPKAILEASAQVEFFDEELGQEPYKCGIFTEKEVNLKNAAGEDAVLKIERAVEPIASAKKFILGLGGEHTITTGFIRPFKKIYPNLEVVHFDAHADMRVEYDGTKWSHACVMRRVHELGVPFTSIGIRALSVEEFEFIRPLRKRYFFAHEICDNTGWMDRALETIKGPVFLTFDIDALDSSIITNTGTPVPGGLTWYQTMQFLKRLMREKRVVGSDLVEFAPIGQNNAEAFAAARLAYKIIGYWCTGRAS